jgi:hypothetical protein
MIKAVPVDADLEVDSFLSFDLSAGDLSSVQKALATLKCPQLAFVGDGETVTLQGVNLDDPTSDVYELTVGETDKNFKIYVFKDNLKVMSNDYRVSICEDCIEFKAETVVYHLAHHSSSDIGDLA